MLEISQTEYVRRLQNSTKEILKKWRRCCFVNFRKQQQRDKQGIITHAYTAITLVAFAVLVYLLNSLEPNKLNGKIMNSQTSTKQTKARPNKKTTESAENISAKKRLSLQIKTHKMTFQHITRHFLSGSFEKACRAVHASCE